jgi:hypothetical protein
MAKSWISPISMTEGKIGVCKLVGNVVLTVMDLSRHLGASLTPKLYCARAGNVLRDFGDEINCLWDQTLEDGQVLLENDAAFLHAAQNQSWVRAILPCLDGGFSAVPARMEAVSLQLFLTTVRAHDLGK